MEEYWKEVEKGARESAPTTLAAWAKLMHEADEATRGQAERDHEAGLRQVRRELKTLRRLRQQEPDPDRRRYLSRRLWDYEKAFRKQRAEYHDEKAAERNSLGRHSKRQLGMQRGTLPTHLRGGSGTGTARSEWPEMFATFWGRHWGAHLPQVSPEEEEPGSQREAEVDAHMFRCAMQKVRGRRSTKGPDRIVYRMFEGMPDAVVSALAQTMDAHAKGKRGADNREWDHAAVTFVAKVKHPATVSQ